MDSLQFNEFEEATLPHLDRLPIDKRRVPVTLDVRVPLQDEEGCAAEAGSAHEFLIVRDRFEWDLEASVRPIEFAKNLVAALSLKVDP